MDGLEFITATATDLADPARADIACFVGLVGRRVVPPRPSPGDAGAPKPSLEAERERLAACLRRLQWSGPALPAGETLLPPEVVPLGDSANSFANWLEAQGWTAPPAGTPGSARKLDLFQATLRLWFNDALATWLNERGFLDPAAGFAADDLLELRDVPVPVESWDDFDALFAWDLRRIAVPANLATPANVQYADTFLGAAVRSFFRQGGRKCFVVRVGEPVPVLVPRATRVALLDRYQLQSPPSPVERSTWRGVGHLFGLPEVSYLCLPDLPDLFGVEASSPLPPRASAGEEKFVECATPIEAPDFRRPPELSPPRCDAAGFGEWAECVVRAGNFLRDRAREVQFLAALPLPVDAAALARTAVLSDLEFAARQAESRKLAQEARAAQWTSAAKIQTAFVQLVYPWLRTRDSGTLPGNLEPPDATLAGMIANLALTRGAWRSVARENVPWLQTVEPVLTRADLDRLIPATGNSPVLSVRERISIFGPTSGGLRLLSDVTTNEDPHWRPASVDRLLNLIVRAARLAGEEFVFANNGEQLWRRVRSALEQLLTALWTDGAFDGASAAEAFDVRCDRTTMTQADLDAGRVIARVEFTAAVPIERIVVVLAMSDAGQVSLVSAERAGTQKEAA